MRKTLIIALIALTKWYATSQTPRLCLLEEFTGEDCLPCAYANPGLNAILAANATQVIAIKWQVPIPTAPTNTWSLYQTNKVDINARAAYYGINFAPQARIDGQHLSAFNTGLADNATNVDAGLINSAQSISSPFSITMLRAWNQTCSAVNLTITVQASSNYTSSGALNFRTVMVERLVQFSVQPGSNGEYTFEDVAIASFPNLTGTALGNSWISGQTQTFTLSCPIPAHTRDKNEIALVGFIQDDGNNIVLQAERADKVALPTTALTTLNAKVNVSCSSLVKPSITIYNNGANPITSFTVRPYTDQILRTNTAWSGNLAVGAATMLTLNSIATPTSNGPHTFSFEVVMGGPYVFTNISNTVKYLVASNYQSIPVAEDFGSTVFPPLNWTLVNPNNGPSWSRTTGTGSFADPSEFGALKFDFYKNLMVGDEDEFYLPPVDLSGTGIPVLSFDLAKAQRAVTNDQLDILASKDCGANWTTIYTKAGAALATTSSLSTAFNAMLPGDWKTVTVPMSGFAESNVLVKFRVINDNGNNMYIDNINLSQPLPAGIAVTANIYNESSIFPNPANEEINLEIKSDRFDDPNIKIVNTAGQLIYQKKTHLIQGSNQIKINTGEFSSGVYFVNIESAQNVIHKKIVVSR